MPQGPQNQKGAGHRLGPIIIGQAAEFDYSGTQACRASRRRGSRRCCSTPTPPTIMTDPDVADHVYIEPMTLEVVERIWTSKSPTRCCPTWAARWA